MLTLSEQLIYVPEHAYIGIVHRTPEGRFQVLYSGFRKHIEHYFRHIDEYKVYSISVGSWDNKKGVMIGVEELNEEK